MKTRIKLPHLMQIIKTKFNDVVWKSFASNVCISSSNLDHKLALSFFDDKVRQDSRTKIVQEQSASVPTINRTFKGSLARISICLVLIATKNIIKPIGKAFVTACDCKLAMPLCSVSVFPLFDIAEIKTAFAVDDPRYIGDLFFGLVFSERYNLSHSTSIV